jgi:putative acetyltransferase
MQINPGDLRDPQVVELLHYHLTNSQEHSGPGSSHALDLNGLQSRDVTCGMAKFLLQWEH